MAPRKTAPKEAAPPRPKGSAVDNGRRGLFARPSKSIGAFVTTQPQRARATSFAGTRLDTQPKAQQTKTGGWEMLAWAMHNDVGELGYIDNLIADTVSDCALRPLRLDPTTREESVDESPEAQRVHDAFTGPRGGQKELLRKAALHLQVGGETMLFGQEAVEATGVSLGVWWEFLSPFELIIDDRGHVVRKADGMSEEKIDPDTCYIARGWRSDPTFSGRADSPVRHVLQVAGEVAVLTQLIDALAKQRLSNGIFYVPQEFSFGPDDESEDETDELTDMIMTHMRTPVEDRSSGASLAPLIMRGPAMIGDKPAKDLMGLVDLAQKLDTYLQGLREEALTRLAQGINAPVEMMLGKGSLAGLGGGSVAAAVDSEFATKHCVPIGELLADFITYAYYRPMLVEYEGLTPEDASLRRLECDASRITARADEAQAADSLHKDDLVSDLTRLRSNGFEESDMPDPDELKIRTALRLIIAAPLVFGPYLIKLLPGFENIEVPVPTRVSETDQIAPGGTSAPPVVPQASAVDSTPVDLFVRMSTAADAALERAMEKAATRILSKAQHKVAIRDRMTGDKVRSLALLTPADLAEIGESPVTLLDGAWDTLAVKTRGWVAEWLESCSVADADDRAFRVSLALAAKMQEFATVNLHKPVKVGRNGNRVPDALITDALAQALGD